MMNMPSDQALKQSEITAIRVLSDSVSAVVRAVEGMREDLRDTRETVIRFEAITSAVTDIKTDVASVEGRVKALELERARRGGALQLSEWVFKYAPWLLAGLCAAITTIILKGGHVP